MRARALLAIGREDLRGQVLAALAELGELRMLTGYASRAKQGAQGAALVADGLAGGTHRDLVNRLRIREATGTVLDHLHVITPAAARRRLGLRDG